MNAVTAPDVDTSVLEDVQPPCDFTVRGEKCQRPAAWICRWREMCTHSAGAVLACDGCRVALQFAIGVGGVLTCQTCRREFPAPSWEQL